MARVRLLGGAVAGQIDLKTVDARWRRATLSPSETMVAWLAQDSLGATEEDPHSRAVTCRLLGQQRIALPSHEFITLRLSVLRVGQGANDGYRRGTLVEQYAQATRGYDYVLLAQAWQAAVGKARELGWIVGGGLFMSYASIVMVRCPTTGREISTGVEMDAATFERLPDIHSQIKCPLCRFDHNWSTREAWLGNPAPSVPALPWLFINNQTAAND